MTIRLLIADDHAILRAGLRMLVEAQSDMRVIAEATDGNETVTRVAEAKPDVVLLDLSMPKSTGLQAIPEIRRRCPRARVLVLSMYEDIAYVRAAFDAGAVGYVLKKAADAELLTAIRTVVGGRNISVLVVKKCSPSLRWGSTSPAPTVRRITAPPHSASANARS